MIGAVTRRTAERTVRDDVGSQGLNHRECEATARIAFRRHGVQSPELVSILHTLVVDGEGVFSKANGAD